MLKKIQISLATGVIATVVAGILLGLNLIPEISDIHVIVRGPPSFQLNIQDAWHRGWPFLFEYATSVEGNPNFGTLYQDRVNLSYDVAVALGIVFFSCLVCEICLRSLRRRTNSKLSGDTIRN
jgi:hypothetical protein